MSDALSLWKTAHIVSAAILFGTGLGIAFFCWFGYRGALRRGEIGPLREVLRLNPDHPRAAWIRETLASLAKERP